MRFNKEDVSHVEWILTKIEFNSSQEIGDFAELDCLLNLLKLENVKFVDWKVKIGKQIDLVVNFKNGRKRYLEVKCYTEASKLVEWQKICDWFVFYVRKKEKVIRKFVISRDELQSVFDRGKVPATGKPSILFGSNMTDLKEYRRRYEGMTTEIEERIIQHPEEFDRRFDRIV